MNLAESKFIQAGDIRTHYLEAGSGPPLVLLHGGGAGADSRSNWRDSLALLAANFRVLAADMVGFGDSDKPDVASYEYSQENRNQWLEDFVDALGLDKVSVVGNSMGGATALGLAMRAPQRVDKLVLMGSAGTRRDGPPSSALKTITDYDFTPQGMRRMIDVLTGPDYQPDEETITYRHQASLREDAKAAYRNIMQWVKDRGGLHYEEADIRKIATPALVLCGKDDLVVPMSRGYRFLELLDNSWGYFIPRCGHWVMTERPEEFVAVTTRFLRTDVHG